MKYIIYGAGIRGKEEVDAIGREHIIAIVDQDTVKIGTNYRGIPIKDKTALAGIDDATACIVTPVAGRRVIAKELRSKGVRNCLLMQPFDRMLLYNKKDMFFSILEQYGDRNIGIYGISAGTMLLYEFLVERMNKTILLIPNESEEEEEYVFLSTNYKIANMDNAISQIDILINTEPYSEKIIEKRISDSTNGIIQRKVQDLFEESLPFYNQQIEGYKNVHSNKRCFIVATGPSLSIDDLNCLYEHGEVCLSMNRIYNLFNRTKWRPDYYLIEDPEMIEDLRREIADLDLPVKFVSSAPDCFWQQENIHNTIQYQGVKLDTGGGMPLFSSRAERCIYVGITVTYSCIEMAAYMGFEEIYLLGVDFNYSNNLYDEKNHFPGYQRDKKVRLNTVFPERMEMAYKGARQYAEANGIHIYNATRGGKLEVFERVEFDSLF